MATNKINCLYDWGEPVRLIPDAPQKYGVLAEGSVCGIRVIDSETVAGEFGEPMGSILYLVEDSEGDAIEVPERFLSSMI